MNDLSPRRRSKWIIIAVGLCTVLCLLPCAAFLFIGIGMTPRYIPTMSTSMLPASRIISVAGYCYHELNGAWPKSVDDIETVLNEDALVKFKSYVSIGRLTMELEPGSTNTSAKVLLRDAVDNASFYIILNRQGADLSPENVERTLSRATISRLALLPKESPTNR